MWTTSPITTEPPPGSRLTSWIWLTRHSKRMRLAATPGGRTTVEAAFSNPAAANSSRPRG
jgi:hypothetical protein